METCLADDFNGVCLRSPTRLEGMETTALHYRRWLLCRSPTRLEGMETLNDGVATDRFGESPTRLEGMETRHGERLGTPKHGLRPALRGWKPPTDYELP